MSKQSIPLVSLHNVGVQFHNKAVLENISLDVQPGELVTLIGPNGAGKTTLLKTILGIVEPSEGNIKNHSNLKVGYVPQKLQIDNTMPITVGRFLSLTPGIQRSEVKSVLAKTGASHTVKQDIHQLSGGEFQRVMLARAILRKPTLLALDEPVQGIDIAGQSELYQLIEEIHQELQCAVLMVSHDLHWVMASTHKVICLNRHVCCTGKPDQVSHDPNYLQAFGKGADALAHYSHHHDHHHHDHPNPVITEETAP